VQTGGFRINRPAHKDPSAVRFMSSSSWITGNAKVFAQMPFPSNHEIKKHT
jgi:hypothetical protein